MTRILFMHEMRRLGTHPVTYAVGSLFLGLMGLLYFLLISEYCNESYPQPAAHVFFSIFWIPALSTIPLITMRSFAQEKASGALELLFVTQVRPIHAVLAKFLSLYIFYLLLWAATLCFPLALYWQWGDAVFQAGLTDPTSLIGGFSFVALTSASYIALGTFISSLTKSQLAAGMLCFSALFGWVIGVKALLILPAVLNSPWIALPDFLSQIDAFGQLNEFTRGLLDMRVFMGYGLITGFFLYACAWKLGSYR
jgi:ABC-2 type transport system permease protein